MNKGSVGSGLRRYLRVHCRAALVLDHKPLATLVLGADKFLKVTQNVKTQKLQLLRCPSFSDRVM
jgi:hypothetical protein